MVPKTPVLIVHPGTRVEFVDSCPPGQMFLIDGETYCVNGEYPYSNQQPSGSLVPQGIGQSDATVPKTKEECQET